jgi:methyl-accepting chemotaxis protein
MTTPRRSAPLLRVLDRLTYPQKFVLISLLFVVPLVAFFPLIYQQSENIRKYGTYEWYGTFYLRPLQDLLQDIQQHQQISQAIRAGESAQADLLAMQSQIDQHLTDLRQVDQSYGVALQSTALKFGISVSTLETQWVALKTNVLTLSDAGSQTQHQTFVDNVNKFISDIGDTSFLILDPDLDTYYMMDTVLLKLPAIQTQLGQLTLASQAALQTQAPLTTDEIANLIVLSSGLRANLEALRVSVEEKAYPNNPSGAMRQQVDAPLRGALASLNQLLGSIEAQVIRAESITLDPNEFMTLARQAAQDTAALYDRASEALETGVNLRRNSQTVALYLEVGIALVGVLIGLALGLLIMLAISRPLNELTQAAQRLGTGDLSERVNVANGDEAGKVGQAFNDFIDTLAGIVRGLVDNSTKLSSSATQLAATSAELSAGADSQTQQVIRTSTAMEEMSATIKDMARNANTTSVAAEAAVQRALLGSAKVQAALTGITQTNHTLQQLQERSAEIDAVVRLIADIAAQTNILALNAAIEAAGAGAAGARFDVVAEEIRKLAGRTAESTSRISATVAEVQRQIQSGAIQMSETAAQAAAVEQALSEIVDGITSVNDMVTLVSTSTTQQAKAADQVAESLQLITQVSQQTAQAMRESTTTIDDLSNLARGMNVTAGRFKT